MFFKPRYKFGEITKRWGDANFKKEFDTILDNWLKQFNEEDTPVLLELLKNFYYYTETAINQKVVELHEKFITVNGEDISNVLFAKMPKEYGVANSDIIFSSYWFNNNVKGFSSNDVIREYLENDAIPTVLAIVDDYMGSGDTIIKALSKMFSIAPELQNSKLYVLMVHTTITGLQMIEEFKTKLGIDLTTIYVDSTDKAFKDDYIFPRIEARLKKEQYELICAGKNVSSNAILGYKDIQSLVSFEKTTPNDTLGLFWHSAENFVSLFRKNSSPRNTSISMLKGVARKNAHRPVVLFDITDNQYNRFIVYCILNGNDFSFEKACADFGITMDLLQKRLEYIAEKGYIKIENGKILPTSETQEKLIKKRLKGWENAERSLLSEHKISLVETSYIPRNFGKSFSGYKK